MLKINTQNIFNALTAILFLVLITGCASSKKLNYFQDKKNVEINENIINYEPTIQFGDIININVSSLQPEAAAPFNIFEILSNGVARPLPYIVNAEGYINFPSLGQFKVSGFTITQVTEELKQKLLPFLNDPIINIRYNNFKISVMGEVRAPGSYPITNERITILEAIALAGDLTIYGKRKTVSLIREQNGKRTFTIIDLTNKKLFNSPFYYLAQNDIIYVESNKTRVNSSSVGPNSYIVVSIVSVLISVAAIILR